jgi:hypothetical protein
MWEAVAAPGRAAELAAWAAAAFPGGAVYTSADDRVVVVADGVGAPDPEPPADLVARAPHGWDFERVR